MLDINRIREQPQEITQALRKRLDHVDLTQVLTWDAERRRLITDTDQLKGTRKRVSAEIPHLKQQGQDTTGPLTEMKKLAGQIKRLDQQLSQTEAQINSFLAELPNIPDADVPPGDKENNQVIRTWNEPPVFNFTPADHMTLATNLDLIDYKRGVKLGGTGFWLYRGLGAQLEWALLNYFIDAHQQAGYQFVLPPLILTHACGYAASQFPKFADEVFTLTGNPEAPHFLLPTAETALLNLHRDEVLRANDLPLKYYAYTPCFRKEAGSYRTQERGTIRGHQFNKVELFQFTRPEDSPAALEALLTQAETLVRGLGLHYRVSKLAAKDCSAAMAKTYDIEVWIPSMNTYMEVSSASNGRDYQARRATIRYKNGTDKPRFVHTLNASGLATSRLLPALLEQHQQANGRFIVPEVLKPWLKRDIIEPV